MKRESFRWGFVSALWNPVIRIPLAMLAWSVVAITALIAIWGSIWLLWAIFEGTMS